MQPLKWYRFAENQVLIEQLRLIYASMTLSVIPMFPAIGLLVWVLISPGNSAGLLWWALLMVLTNAYSIFHARRQLDLGLAAQNANHLARRLMFAITLGGVSWGALAFGALGNTSATGDILVIFVLSGILGGAVSLLAPVFLVFVAFSFPLVGLTVARLWQLGDANYDVFGLIAVMYLGVLIGQARNSSVATRAAIALRFENLELVLKAEAAQQAAEKANTAKSKFLAAASHDLRQPIHAQGLFLDVLLHTPLSTHQRELVGNICAASTASADMLNTLLDFSRIEAGVVSPQKQAFGMQHLLNKIEREFEPQADAKGLRYRSRETPVRVQSDPALVELILRNLVSNAIRYSDKGGLLVACRSRGAHTLLEVWDTGMGIAPENQAEVFKEFHQLGNPERDRQKGLGLGLAIAQGLAKTLGHALSVQSWPMRGSVFKLALPIAQHVPLLTPTAAEAGFLPHLPAGVSLDGARILVIDDDEAVLSSMVQLLGRWGCEVGSAGSIARALQLAPLHTPDMLISDYRLRGHTTGTEAIAQVRALLGVAVPALLITGDTAPERLREAMSSGIPLLHKPLAPSQLYQAIKLGLGSQGSGLQKTLGKI